MLHVCSVHNDPDSIPTIPPESIHVHQSEAYYFTLYILSGITSILYMYM